MFQTSSVQLTFLSFRCLSSGWPWNAYNIEYSLIKRMSGALVSFFSPKLLNTFCVHNRLRRSTFILSLVWRCLTSRSILKILHLDFRLLILYIQQVRSFKKNGHHLTHRLITEKLISCYSVEQTNKIKGRMYWLLNLFCWCFNVYRKFSHTLTFMFRTHWSENLKICVWFMESNTDMKL